MDGHGIRPDHVRDNELVPAATSDECHRWTLRGSILFRVDSACEELSADDHQRGCGHSLRGGIVPTFWLTTQANELILYSLKHTQELMMNPFAELKEAVNEMKAAGLSTQDMCWEFLGAVSIFAVPIALFIVLAPYF